MVMLWHTRRGAVESEIIVDEGRVKRSELRSLDKSRLYILPANFSH